ncbi:hypothetical protein [Streptomyces sp. NPDC096311]|uniref:hypothetical protein n=1 Tax=Streptomyces sp. NPDC096311 TaxID=3366083 RepID=UPI0037F982BD
MELLGDQWGAEPGTAPNTVLLNNADPVYFTIAPDEEVEGVLRIRNIDKAYTQYGDTDTRLLPSGTAAVIAQYIFDVIGEIF